MPTKQCNTCNKFKPLNEFGINRKKDNSSNFHSGIVNIYAGDCKVCLAIKQKIWRDAHPNYWKKVNNKVHTGKITKYPKEDRYLLSAIRDRISNARQNSKRNPERDFNIDAEYMYQMWKNQNGLCALSNQILLLKKNTPYTLSIDKIYPNKGYIKGNVQWVIWAANRAKGDLTIQELLLLCNNIIEKCRDYP